MGQVITLEQLNDYSTTPVDPARGQLVVDGVNNYIASQTRRGWGELSSVTEVHDFAPTIFLNQYPVTAINSVTIGRPGWTPITLPPISYYVNEIGRLVITESRSVFGRPLRDRVTVVYSTGTTDIPADLTLAALSLAADLLLYAEDGQHELVREDVGSYKLMYATVDQLSTGKVASAIIKRYAAREL